MRYGKPNGFRNCHANVLTLCDSHELKHRCVETTCPVAYLGAHPLTELEDHLGANVNTSHPLVYQEVRMVQASDLQVHQLKRLWNTALENWSVLCRMA